MTSTPTLSAIGRGISDFDTEAALGRLISGGRVPLRAISQFGENPSVGTVQEGVWSQGGPFNWLEAPESVRVAAGGDVADDAAGIGARGVVVEGICASLKIVRETIPTAGVSASVETTTKFWRVWNVEVETVGEYGGANVGSMTIEGSDTSTVLAMVPLGDSRASFAQFSTPKDRLALIRHVIVSVEGIKNIDMDVCIRNNFTNTTGLISPFMIVRKFIGLGDFHTEDPKSLILLPPLTDFFMIANTSSGTSALSVGFDVLLIPTT